MKIQLILSKVFFSKANFNDFDIKYDFRKFLLELKNFTVFTDLEDEIELKQYLFNDENNFWESLLENSPRIIYNQPIIELAENMDFYHINPARKLFLLDIEQEKAKEFRDRFGYEFICPNNLRERWQIYKRYRDDELMPTGSLMPEYINSWEYFNNYRHPSNTLIIFDKYLFTEFAEDRNRNEILLNSINDNFYQFLDIMMPNSALQDEYKLIIITSAKNIKMRTYPISYEQLRSPRDRFIHLGRRINSHIRRNFPQLNISFSLVNYHPAKIFRNFRIKGDQNEHSRNIFTSYFHFTFDRGVNIVPISQVIDGRAETDIAFRFYYRSPFYNSASRHLYRLSEYLRKIEEHRINNRLQDTSDLLFNYNDCSYLNVTL